MLLLTPTMLLLIPAVLADAELTQAPTQAWPTTDRRKLNPENGWQGISLGQ